MIDQKRILIIDDEIAATSLLASSLRDVCSCDVANTVAAALAKLAAGSYDTVVCDLVLDGDAAALHDALSSRGVPVLLLSGRKPEELARVATARGWSYIAKPVSPTAIRREVAALCGAPDPEPTGQHRRGLIPLQEPVPPTTPSQPPAPPAAAPPVPVAVLILDRGVDLAGIVATAYLCAAGRVDGPLALAVIGAIAGVGGITRAASRARGAGVGLAGAAVLAMASALTPATAQAQTTRGSTPPAHVGAAVLALVLLLTSGCATVAKAVSPGGGMAAVASSLLSDLRDVRAVVCTVKLDPLLGDPRGDLDASSSAASDAAVTGGQ